MAVRSIRRYTASGGVWVQELRIVRRVFLLRIDERTHTVMKVAVMSIRELWIALTGKRKKRK